jgi:hypothetical protein
MPVLHHISRLQEVRVKSLTKLGFFKKSGPNPLSTSTKLNSYMHTPEANSYSCVGKLWKLNPKIKTHVLLHRSTRLSSNSYPPKRNKNKDLYEEKHIHKKKNLKCQKVEAGYSNRICTEKADRALHEGVPAVYVHHRCCYLPCVTFFLYSEEKCNAPWRGRKKSLQSSFSQLRKREKDDRGFATARSWSPWTAAKLLLKKTLL